MDKIEKMNENDEVKKQLKEFQDIAAKKFWYHTAILLRDLQKGKTVNFEEYFGKKRRGKV